jgi:aminobenzoyl-glutamate transport protein
VVFAGVSSSIAADAGFVVLPPIAAAIFARLGRPPLVGIALAYVGVAGGFSANLFVTSLDPMLAGATQSAAQLLDPDAVVPVTANYFFMVVSVLLVVAVGWVVTEKVVEPKVTAADIAAQLRAGAEAGEAGAENAEDPARERRGLWAAGLTAAAVGSALLALVLVPGAPLHGTVELRPGVEMPAWARALIPLLFVVFVTPGIAFGVARGTIRSDKDVARMMTETMAAMGGYVVLAFFCGQFVAWFGKSGLGTLLALKGIEGLAAWRLPEAGLVVAIVLLSAALNLFIGSASAKWFLLAPVFVPLFLGLGVAPELTQAAYRVGDSATNPIAPLNPYIVVIIVFMRRWFPGAGMGTVIALTLPYSTVLLAAWTVLLLAWSLLGLPLGPG